MRAVRSPLPPGHVECRRCSGLVSVADAVTVCAECHDALTAAQRIVERTRERRQAALADGAAVRYLTPEQAAAQLGCTARRVRQLAQQGMLPHRRILSRVYLREDAVGALIRDSGASGVA